MMFTFSQAVCVLEAEQLTEGHVHVPSLAAELMASVREWLQLQTTATSATRQWAFTEGFRANLIRRLCGRLR